MNRIGNAYKQVSQVTPTNTFGAPNPYSVDNDVCGTRKGHQPSKQEVYRSKRHTVRIYLCAHPSKSGST
jgi:hypothetical protein